MVQKFFNRRVMTGLAGLVAAGALSACSTTMSEDQFNALQQTVSQSQTSSCMSGQISGDGRNFEAQTFFDEGCSVQRFIDLLYQTHIDEDGNLDPEAQIVIVALYEQAANNGDGSLISEALDRYSTTVDDLRVRATTGCEQGEMVQNPDGTLSMNFSCDVERSAVGNAWTARPQQ